jgi:small-conductance mechanosensitive channel
MFESVEQTRAKRTISPVVRAVAVAAFALLIVSFGVLAAQSASPTCVVIVFAVLWIPTMITALLSSKLIDDARRRMVVQAVILAVFLSPSVVVGEGGVAPCPAVVVMFIPHEFMWGLVPLVVGVCVALVIARALERFQSHAAPPPQS